MKVLSVVGARPQFIKLAPICAAMASAEVGHVIVHTGQHYDDRMSDVIFADLGIPAPDYNLGVGSATHGRQTGGMLAALDGVLEESRPDWVVVYGDTNSTIAGALAATKMHIAVAHVEAGLRSFNRAMPEEINRVMTDHASDLCLAPTAVAMDHLSNEGLGERSLLIGDVMTDVCLGTRDLVAGKPLSFTPDGPFVMATLHRAENTDGDEHLRSLLTSISQLSTRVVLAVHPRLAAAADRIGFDLTTGAIEPVEPLSYPEMVAAVSAASAVITDSGGLQKEAFLLRTPAITLRTETEWPETLSGGWNVLDPTGRHISELLARTLSVPVDEAPYGDGQAAARCVRALQKF